MDAANGYEAVALNFIAARLPDGAAVLDLGCGCGEPIAAVFVAQGLAVYGVEASAFFDRPFHAIVAWGLLFPLPPATQRELIGKMGRALGRWRQPGSTWTGSESMKERTTAIVQRNGR